MNSETQVSLARDGDEHAFAMIVSEHQSDVLRVCFVICANRDMAQDAAQSAWALVWMRLTALRDPTRIRAWILAIAANEARQHLRRERVRRLLPGWSWDEPIKPHPRDLDLQAALDSLSSDDRRLLALRHIGGLSSIEIGAALHSSPSAIRMRLSRLHERLRKELRDD